MNARRSLACLIRSLPCVLAMLMCGSAPALADGACPNEQVRGEQGSTRLPDCRAYEMVSPVFKGGFDASLINGGAENGESVAFFSPGAFAGAPSSFSGELSYLARRGASEWSTTPLMAPAPLIAETQAGDMTPSLNMVLEMGHPGPNTFHPIADEQDLLLHSTESPDTSEGWRQIGTITPLIKNEEDQFRPAYRAASLDFCSVLLAPTATDHLLPLPPEAAEQLYEFDRGCNGEPQSLALVGLNNKHTLINLACPVSPGDEKYGSTGNNAFNAVSADGREVFFTVCVSGSEEGLGSDHQLFVRLAGSRTVEVSRPLAPACEAGGAAGEVPCEGASARAGANFAGASEDGSKVYFTAPLAAGQLPLVPGDTDASDNLYMATIGCAQSKPACGAAEREVISLSQVSHDPASGQAANVMGVVRVAPDGTRVYFVAGGDLLSHGQQQALEGEARRVPQVGAANLYAYDSGSGTVAFVGDLCSGSLASGGVEDVYCPSGGSDEQFWMDNEAQAQTAGKDGRFLAFATYAQLLSGDTNVARDVYRYDALSGRLGRVSGGEGGYDDNGNRTVLAQDGEALGASIAPGHYGGSLREQYELDNRAISEDGSRIVFTSAEPLSAAATNGLANAYEWHEGIGGGGEGRVSLISSGDSEAAAEDVMISASGRDVFFVTDQGLLPQDTDGVADIYDARLDGGFPVAAAPPQPCSGDACQGPLTSSAPLLVPGSVPQAPGGNFPPLASSTKAKAKPKSTSCRKGYTKRKGHCVKHRGKRKAKKSKARRSK
jgi:hypothetical protein